MKIKEKKINNEPLDSGDFFTLLIMTFKTDFLTSISFYLLDALTRIGFSILILYLFNAVADGNYTIAYIYCAVEIVLWYLSQLFRQVGFTDAFVLASKIKAALAMLLYAKISKMTNYGIKNSELGKIINLLASDFGVIEQRLGLFCNAFNFPIVMIGCTILLIIRLGWPGVLGIVMVILVVPISNAISKNNGSIIKEINIYKDKRIQTTT